MKLTLLAKNITSMPVAETVAQDTVVKDIRIIYLIISMVVLFAVLVAIAVIYDKKNRQKPWKKKGKYRSRQKLSERFFAYTYRFLFHFPLTRGYIEKMSYRYRFISPCDSKEISKKTVIACFLSWCICSITFTLVYFCNPSINTLITAVVGIAVADSVVIGSLAKYFEIESLQETQKMIANVEHNYYVEYRVDDALYRSMDNLSSNIKRAASQIYELLLSDDKELALREYYENVPNKFLRAFVSQCIGVMDRGDQEVDGKYLFVRNLENLQKQIEIETEKLQRLSMEFMGVVFVVVAPIFCIDFVKKFAISIKENMDTFYYGKQGFLLDMGLLSFTVCIYFVMRKSAEFRTFHQSSYHVLFAIERISLIKTAMDNYCDKNASKIERLKRMLRNNGNNIRPRHFILRSFLITGAVFFLGIGITSYLHIQSKELLIAVQKADMEMLTSAAQEDQYETMGQVVEEYTKKYVMTSKGVKLTEIPESQEEMVSILEDDGTFYSKLINEALAKEILSRVNAYKKEYFSLLDLSVCLLLSIFAYYLPNLMLKYNSTVSKDAMEDEVNQFNALISMLMYTDGMTVKQILEEMESFAVVFKQSLQVCINDYGSGDMEALNALKEKEPYDSFNRIVDNLIRCDDMPIEQAFHEIDVERDGYMAKRKLANEKSIRKRVGRAYLLAAIPLILLFAYGVLPPLVTSLKEINTMLEELQNSSL